METRFVLENRKGIMSCARPTLDQGVDYAPLGKRGWVVQERATSRRTLHFGPHQIYWECRTTHACEAYPNGLLRSMSRREAKAFWTQDREKRQPPLALTSRKLKSKEDMTQEELLRRHRAATISSLCREIKLRRQKHRCIEQSGDAESVNWTEIHAIDIGGRRDLKQDDSWNLAGEEYLNNGDYPADPDEWPEMGYFERV